MIDEKKFMEDARGRLVPINNVDEIDMERDALVKEIAQRAIDLQRLMIEFKRAAMGDVGAFVDLSAEKYGVKIGGQKGNISLVSFDGRMKLQVAISEHIAFDERLQAAKKLIDECLTSWAAESRDEIKILVMDAFQVDQEGRINTGRILALRRLNITDGRWKRAMDAISDSIQVVGSKSYLRVYRREEQTMPWTAVALDLAVL